MTLFGVPFNMLVYQRRRFTTIDQLKRAIVTDWGKLSFKTLDISQGSVASHVLQVCWILRRWYYYKFSPDSDSEIIVKIG